MGKFPLVLTLCDPISKRILHILYISYMLPKFPSRQYTPNDLPLKIKSLRRCDRKGLNIRMYGRVRRSGSAVPLLPRPQVLSVFQIAGRARDSAIESTKRRSRVSRSRIVAMNKYKECEYPSEREQRAI